MSRQRKRCAGWSALVLVVVGLASIVAGCGGGGGTTGPSTGTGGGKPGNKDVAAGAQAKVGPGEGRLDLVAWAGYVENGSTDPKVDWVTPFTQKTGCKVNVTIGQDSSQMVTLMKTGNFDGVSASGDASLRLVAGEDVKPVNVTLVPNYKDVIPALKDQPYNTLDDVHYGIPHGRGANILMWNKAVVKESPDSWGVLFDPNSPYKGKVSIYGFPIYIADAAVYLKATQPDLGIDNPYELDDKQFQAAVDLLKQQRQIVGQYWPDATSQIQSFEGGDTVIGTTWQYQANTIGLDKKIKVATTLPKEGATGWSDTWMISSKAKHPNCMYMWMDWIVSPEANAQVAEWFGEAPANSKSCALTADKNHCETFHAADEAYFDRVYEWQTPISDCGDDRGEECKDFAAWQQAWTEIKG
jgi:putative spermidine/putrescine transport system substrate-binding protein